MANPSHHEISPGLLVTYNFDVSPVFCSLHKHTCHTPEDSLDAWRIWEYVLPVSFVFHVWMLEIGRAFVKKTARVVSIYSVVLVPSGLRCLSPEWSKSVCPTVMHVQFPMLVDRVQHVKTCEL